MHGSEQTVDTEFGELHLHRVLVAIDGSPSSDLALSAATTLARRDNAALTLVTVEPDVLRRSAQWTVLSAAPPDTQEAAHERAQKVLDQAVARTPADIPVTTVLRFGRVGPEIVAQSKSANYDAILVGARGVGRVGTLLGSVSQHVLHHAETAVFVIHAPLPTDSA